MAESNVFIDDSYFKNYIKPVFGNRKNYMRYCAIIEEINRYNIMISLGFRYE